MGNQRNGIAGPNEGSETAANGKFSLITAEKLNALYKNLLKCRMLSRQPGTNGASGTIRGHEAALVGSTIDLATGDTVWFDDYGLLAGFSHAATIADVLPRAGNRRAAAVRVKAAERNGASGSSRTYVAIGTALANKTMVNKKITVVFSNKESRATAGEALHIAAVHNLPMIFVHQADGEWKKILGTIERRKKNDSREQQRPWFPHIAVDRDDVVAMYRVASEAISRARLGRGPTLIECRPLRVSHARNGHGHDPIRHMEHYLRARGLFDPK